MKPVLVLRHTPTCPLGSVAALLKGRGLIYRYVDLFAGVPKRLELEESSGLIVLGGPMSANDTDEYPFLEAELAWLRQAVDTHLPTLGICLGAQLLAKALGKTVYSNRVKEIGWYQIKLLPPAAADPLFSACRTRETVFQWHGDTFELPAGAVHLARSQLCPNQAFRYGPCAYGLQFHVEMTPELLAEWCEEPELHSQIGDHADLEAIREEAPRQFPRMDVLSEQLLTRFAELCQSPEARHRPSP